MELLLVGVILIAGAFTAVYFALAGMPVKRVSKERLAGYRVVEDRTSLSRLSTALVSRVETVLKRRGWRPFSAAELELAGVKTPVASLVVLVGCIAVVAFAVGIVILQSVIAAIVLALVVPVMAKLWLRVLASRRRKAFAGQLIAALQTMAASLRAGHSLPRVLDAVSQDAESPMSEELARVVNENRLGRDLVEAMEQVAERMQSKDFLWVAGAIAAQRETGGNLNQILDQVAETIRERHHVRQQVTSLAAEGKISAYILMSLPVLMGIYYTVVNKAIMVDFIDSGIGKLLLVGSLLLYVVGGFWMRAVIRIEF